MAKIKIIDNSSEVTPEDVEAAAEEALKKSSGEVKQADGSEDEVTDNAVEADEIEETEEIIKKNEEVETISLDEEGEPVSDEITPEEENTDPELNKVVDEVIVEDSDELLDREDEEIEAISEEPKTTLGQKIKNFFKAWWSNKIARNATLISAGLLSLALILTPMTRYFILNLSGVRVSATVKITDEQTSQPLKNVTVGLAGKTVVTDSEGLAQFEKLKLGETELVVEKRAFATVKRPHTLGLGSNPLGEVGLKATGAIFNFEVRDWLSNKPLEKAEATSGESSAISDKEGKIALVLDAQASENAIIKISYKGYRTEEIPITSTTGLKQQIALVPAKKHGFISKRSGKYDLYSIDVDGKNEKLILAGTGLEKEGLTLAIDPLSNQAAFVTNREDKRNKDGFLFSGLYVVDLTNGALAKVTDSERVQIIGWYGQNLVYVQITEGVSASNPRRHRLVTYNVKEDTKAEIASSNYFNDVLSAGGKIFYAPSNAYQENTGNAKLFMVNPDGKDRKTILGQEVWNIIRTDYKKLALATQQNWYNYNIGEQSASQATGAPSNVRSKIFVDSPSGSEALWVDERDGKGVLLIRNIKTAQDRILVTLPGLKAPAFWVNENQIVFRVNTSDETADYIISTSGGEPKKITDTSNTSGVDNWYFY